mmetsp:Transcript_121935/g.341337  ORF Transcript_121935/g.341337 Transcript_121935/m.341337 type:complete len:297 (-) Transcript_121935:298-1188(-)
MLQGSLRIGMELSQAWRPQGNILRGLRVLHLQLGAAVLLLPPQLGGAVVGGESGHRLLPGLGDGVRALVSRVLVHGPVQRRSRLHLPDAEAVAGRRVPGVEPSCRRGRRADADGERHDCLEAALLQARVSEAHPATFRVRRPRPQRLRGRRGGCPRARGFPLAVRNDLCRAGRRARDALQARPRAPCACCDPLVAEPCPRRERPGVVRQQRRLQGSGASHRQLQGGMVEGSEHRIFGDAELHDSLVVGFGPCVEPCASLGICDGVPVDDMAPILVHDGVVFRHRQDREQSREPLRF